MRRGNGKPTIDLINRVSRLLKEAGYIDIIDEIWIDPVKGYWLKQDCYRWEGLVKGMLLDKPVTLAIASWEKIKDCNCKGLDFNIEGYVFEFYSGK